MEQVLDLAFGRVNGTIQENERIRFSDTPVIKKLSSQPLLPDRKSAQDLEAVWSYLYLITLVFISILTWQFCYICRLTNLLLRHQNRVVAFNAPIDPYYNTTDRLTLGSRPSEAIDTEIPMTNVASNDKYRKKTPYGHVRADSDNIDL